MDKRDRQTRKVRWEKLDDDFTYYASHLDRDVVASDQIRTVVRTFRDKLFTEIFPGRTDVPKTLIFAKDDSHADDIVQIVREEFGKGNDFCAKITYKTTRQPRRLDQLVPQQLQPPHRRHGRHDRHGNRHQTARSRHVHAGRQEPQLLRADEGSGRPSDPGHDFQAVTPDAKTKTHFVIVDCVGICEQALVDTQPLEKKKSVSFEKLLQAVAFGNTQPDVLSSLAGRLARLDRQLGQPEREALAQTAGGKSIRDLVADLVAALDPDRHLEAARAENGLGPDQTPTPEQVAQAAEQQCQAAAAPVASNPALRQKLVDTQKKFEQTIDTVSRDTVLEASYSAAAREKAHGLVRTFEDYLKTHKDEITALQVLYSRPYAQRLKFSDIKGLAEAIKSPPCGATPEALWRAYETLDQSKVHGAGTRRLMTDIVSLVRFALHQEGELVPFADQVQERFAAWLDEQQAHGRAFTTEQREWLELIRDHIAANLAIEVEDFDTVPFNQRGGLGRVYQLFGADLELLLDELNGVLSA